MTALKIIDTDSSWEVFLFVGDNAISMAGCVIVVVCNCLLYTSEVADEAELSFAWQADPIKQPPVDEVTFLPVLSFYKKKITLK